MLVSWRTEIMASKVSSVNELPLNIIKNRPDAQSIVQGVTDRSLKGNALPFYNRQDPALIEEWFDDFNYFNTSKYLVTKVEAGSGSATQTVSGSVLTIQNDDAAGDFTCIQPQIGDNTNIANFINPVAEKGRDIFFRARVRIPDVSVTKFQIGLMGKNPGSFPTFGSFNNHIMFTWKQFGSPILYWQYGLSVLTNIWNPFPGRLLNPIEGNRISVEDSYTVPYPTDGSGSRYQAYAGSSEGTISSTGLPIADPEYPIIRDNEWFRLTLIYKAGNHKAPNGQDTNGRLEFWLGADNRDDQCLQVVYPDLSDITDMTSITPSICIGNDGGTSSAQIDYMHAGQFKGLERVGKGD